MFNISPAPAVLAKRLRAAKWRSDPALRVSGGVKWHRQGLRAIDRQGVSNPV
jgi:hypothetical protein